MKTNHPFIDSVNGIEESIKELKTLFLKDPYLKLVYNNEDLIELLGISQSTLKRWRADGIIGYSIIGNKIFYRSEDIMEMFNNYYIPIKKKLPNIF